MARPVYSWSSRWCQSWSWLPVRWMKISTCLWQVLKHLLPIWAEIVLTGSLVLQGYHHNYCKEFVQRIFKMPTKPFLDPLSCQCRSPHDIFLCIYLFWLCSSQYIHIQCYFTSDLLVIERKDLHKQKIYDLTPGRCQLAASYLLSETVSIYGSN